jgi:malate synthase
MEGIKEIQEAQKEIKEEVKNEVDKKIQDIEKSFTEKETAFKKQLEAIYNDFEKKLQSLKESNDDVTIRIFSTYSNSELELPNKKIIAGLGVGSRLVIKDKDGKTIGMEIDNITYDGVELNQKPLVEIFLKKV